MKLDKCQISAIISFKILSRFRLFGAFFLAFALTTLFNLKAKKNLKLRPLKLKNFFYYYYYFLKLVDTTT